MKKNPVLTQTDLLQQCWSSNRKGLIHKQQLRNLECVILAIICYSFIGLGMGPIFFTQQFVNPSFYQNPKSSFLDCIYIHKIHSSQNSVGCMSKLDRLMCFNLSLNVNGQLT